MRYCDKCFAPVLEGGQGNREWCPRVKKTPPINISKELDELFGSFNRKPKKKL